MKVEVNKEIKNTDLPFPKLMTNEHGSIVLFERENIGLVIKSAVSESDNFKFHSNFDMSIYYDFKGSITITQ